jgi:Acyl-CoA dehydrogenase, N-terminal domain
MDKTPGPTHDEMERFASNSRHREQISWSISNMPIAAPLIGKQRPHSMTNESEPLRHFQQRPDRSSRQSIDVEIAQVTRGTMSHETALSNVKEIADRVLAPAARQSDKEGRFSTEAVDALGRARLLGLLLPAESGGLGLGPSTFAAVTATLAEADASVAMIYLMHVCAAATIAGARPGAAVAIAAQGQPASCSGRKANRVNDCNTANACIV